MLSQSKILNLCVCHKFSHNPHAVPTTGSKQKNKNNGKQYNPLQGTTTFHSTSFKNSTDRYTIKLITHTIEIKSTFTYHSPQIQKVTNLFRNTKIGIAFKATATLQQLITPTTQNLKSDYEKSETHKITCKTCHVSYVGQTS